MVRLLGIPFALVALLAVLAVGCGGGQSAGNVSLPVLKSLKPVATATKKADSARFEMQFEMTMPGFGEFAFSANGAFDTPSQRAEITMDLGSFADFMSGMANSFGGNAPPELADPSKWKLEMRLDGTVAYMRVPFLASELPFGKEWVRIDLSAAARLQGLNLEELQAFANGSDPRQTLDYLRAVSGKLTRLGVEKVREVPSTHYFALVDFKKALAKAARDANQPGLFDQLGSFGNAFRKIPVDVWVDEDNLVRRMTMEFSFAAPGQPDQSKASMTIELFDYGKPVRVVPPSAADVVDAFSLSKG